MVINCSLSNWAFKVSTKETYAGMAKGMYKYEQIFNYENICNLLFVSP
jgi:hypothetical protein